MRLFIATLLLFVAGISTAHSAGDFVRNGSHNGTLPSVLSALEQSGNAKLFTEITGYSPARLRQLAKEGAVEIKPCGAACESVRSTRITARTSGDNVRTYNVGNVEAWRDVKANERAIFVHGRPIALVHCANPLVASVCISCCPQTGPARVDRRNRYYFDSYSAPYWHGGGPHYGGRVRESRRATIWQRPSAAPKTMRYPQ